MDELLEIVLVLSCMVDGSSALMLCNLHMCYIHHLINQIAY